MNTEASPRPESGQDTLKRDQDPEALINRLTQANTWQREDLVSLCFKAAHALSQLQTVERERDAERRVAEIAERQASENAFALLAAEDSLLRLRERVREVVGPFALAAEHLGSQTSFHGKSWSLDDDQTVEAVIRRVDGAIGPSGFEDFNLGHFRAAAALLLSLGWEGKQES
jgi:hypothetical protein